MKQKHFEGGTMMNYPITDHEKFMMEKMGDYLARYVETSSPVTPGFSAQNPLL